MISSLHCQHFLSLVRVKGQAFDLVNFLGLSLSGLEGAHLDFSFYALFPSAF